MLQNRAVLVTGGVSVIGAAICRALAGRGASVAFTCPAEQLRSEELLDELEELGGRALFVAADPSSAEEVLTAVAQAEKVFGRIDALIVTLEPEPAAPLDLLEEEAFQQAMDRGLKPPFLFAKAAAPAMALRGQGVIITVAPPLAAPSMLPAATVRAGLCGLTAALGAALEGHGVRVNAVLPDLPGSADEPGAEGWPQVHEVTELVALLASELAGPVNGQVFDLSRNRHGVAK